MAWCLSGDHADSRAARTCRRLVAARAPHAGVERPHGGCAHVAGHAKPDASAPAVAQPAGSLDRDVHYPRVRRVRTEKRFGNVEERSLEESTARATRRY